MITVLDHIGNPVNTTWLGFQFTKAFIVHSTHYLNTYGKNSNLSLQCSGEPRQNYTKLIFLHSAALVVNDNIWTGLRWQHYMTQRLLLTDNLKFRFGTCYLQELIYFYKLWKMSDTKSFQFIAAHTRQFILTTFYSKRYVYPQGMMQYNLGFYCILWLLHKILVYFLWLKRNVCLVLDLLKLQ